MVELALFSLHPQSPASREDFTVYLSHDLSMLRLMETFAESAPQLVLLLAVMLQQGSVDVFIGVSPPLLINSDGGSGSAHVQGPRSNHHHS